MAARKGLSEDADDMYHGKNLHCPFPTEPLRQPAAGKTTEHSARGGDGHDPTFGIGIFRNGERVETKLRLEGFHDNY